MYFSTFIEKIKDYLFAFIIGIIIVICIGIYQFKFNSTTLQLIEFDLKDNQSSVVDKFFVNEGSVIKLDKYDGNEITIKKVSSKGVVISRRIVTYEFIPAPDGMDGGKSISRYENVEEYVPFDEEFIINKDEKQSGPDIAVEQARFSYTLKFVKN